MNEYETEGKLLERVYHRVEKGVRVSALFRLKAYLEDRLGLPRASNPKSG